LVFIAKEKQTLTKIMQLFSLLTRGFFDGRKAKNEKNEKTKVNLPKRRMKKKE